MICKGCGCVFSVVKGREHTRQYCSKKCFYGDPFERFSKFIKVDEETGCWNWTGSERACGYGQFKMDGTMTAHRASWVLIKGAIPEGKNVLHRCIGNRKCVNPTHLYLGSHKDNTRDILEQGRRQDQYGSNNPIAILDEAKVVEIRTHATKHGDCARYARKFNVGINAVISARNGETWTRVPMPQKTTC